MMDFLIRSFKHPLDYLGIVKLHTLHLIRVEQHSDQIYSFIFTIPEDMIWKPGQHGLFWFLYDHIKGNNWRAFSIASDPKEGEIRITTSFPETPSEFKQKLRSLEPGDTITMQGPFGEFHVHHEMKNAVGVAGGIGITPFRSILHAIADGRYPGFHLKLIYASSHGEFPFQDELNTFAQSDQIDIAYVNTADEVNEALNAEIAARKDIPYFISGSPGMIKALRASCVKQGAVRIINDPFKGY